MEDNRAKAILRECVSCGRLFSITQKTVDRMESLGYALPVRCRECNGLKKKTKPLVCKQCGTTFQFSRLEEDNLRKKYGEAYRDPKYCMSCRSLWQKTKRAGEAK